MFTNEIDPEKAYILRALRVAVARHEQFAYSFYDTKGILHNQICKTCMDAFPCPELRDIAREMGEVE